MQGPFLLYPLSRTSIRTMRFKLPFKLEDYIVLLSKADR